MFWTHLFLFLACHHHALPPMHLMHPAPPVGLVNPGGPVVLPPQ